MTMADYATIDEVRALVRSGTDEILDVLRPFIQDTSDKFEAIDRRFEGIDRRLDSIDYRLDTIETRLSAHDKEFAKLNKKYDHLINTIDAFVGRIDAYELEQAARDHKVDRLERWIQEIAASTGVKLSA